MLSKEIKKELFNMFLGIIILTSIMLVVFALFGNFNLPTFFGALFGSLVAWLNFLFLAVSVEFAVRKDKNPKLVVSSSYTLRMLFIGAMIIVAIKSELFNYVSMIIPLVFPQIVIFYIKLIKKRKNYECKR